MTERLIEMNVLQARSLASCVNIADSNGKVYDMLRAEDSDKEVGAIKMTLEDHGQLVWVTTIYVDGSVG